MNRKAVVFGGGTGMSYLLRGLKQYPLDITAVVSVCDDGGSTGKLREEFDILAPGDLRKVIESLAENEGEIKRLLNYRFSSDGDLNNHSLGNLIVLAEMKLQGSVTKAMEALGKLLDLKGKVLPFTEDKPTLVGLMDDGSIIEGEHHITEAPQTITRVSYKEEPDINENLLYEIQSADVIILSMGSLFTSVIPNLLSEQIKKAIDESNAKIIYCCNMFTQPGETENMTVSDHIKTLNSYLGDRKIEYVIANDGEVDEELVKTYETAEQKELVKIDEDEIRDIGVNLVTDDLVFIKKESSTKKDVLRHNYMKLGFLINALALDYQRMLRITSPNDKK